MYKQFCLVAIAVVAAVSIGCSGAAPPTGADVKSNPPAAAAEAVKAANASEEAGETKNDPDAGAAAMGNKGNPAARKAPPPGTPPQ